MKGDRLDRLMYVAPFVCVGLLWLSTPVSAFLIVFGVPLAFLIAFTANPELKRARSDDGWEPGYRIE